MTGARTDGKPCAAGKDLSPSEFEGLGRPRYKKWKWSIRVLRPDGAPGETLGQWLEPREAPAEVRAHPARPAARAPRLLGLPAHHAACCSGWLAGPAAWCWTGLAVWVGASSLGPAASASLSPLCKSPRCESTAAEVG